VLRCRRGAVARAAVQLQDGRSQDSSQDPLQGGYVCGGSRRETPRDVFIVTVRYHNREQYKQKGLAPHCKNIYFDIAALNGIMSSRVPRVQSTEVTRRPRPLDPLSCPHGAPRPGQSCRPFSATRRRTAQWGSPRAQATPACSWAGEVRATRRVQPAQSSASLGRRRGALSGARQHLAAPRAPRRRRPRRHRRPRLPRAAQTHTARRARRRRRAHLVRVRVRVRVRF